MNKCFSLGVTGLLMLAAGCASTTDKAVLNCGPGSGLYPINIKYKKNTEISVVNSVSRDARPGEVIRFRVVGKSDLKVTVSGKASDPNAAWISGTAMPDRSGRDRAIDVCIDPTQPDGDYGYDVSVATVGVLDPVVTVRRN